jgi:hypothetical protein
VIDHRLGRRIWRDLSHGVDPFASVRGRLGDRAYLGEIAQRHASKHKLPFARIADLVSAAPPQ